jgi:hypothetical protein
MIREEFHREEEKKKEKKEKKKRINELIHGLWDCNIKTHY